MPVSERRQHRAHGLPTLAGLLLIGACASPQPAPETVTAQKISAVEYAALQQSIRTNNNVRQAMEEQCKRDAALRTQEQREAIAAVLDVEPGDINRVFCERMVDSIGRGDISYEDFLSFGRSKPDMASFRRVLRALRQPARSYAI